MLRIIDYLPRNIAVSASKYLRDHEAIITYTFDDNTLGKHYIKSINRAYNSIN